MRHGTTMGDDQVDAMVRIFQIIDRGGDPSTIVRSEPVRRFRETLLRMQKKRDQPAEEPVQA